MVILRSKLTLLAMSMVVASLCSAAPALQPGARTYELGPDGEIRNWLVLGYLPGVVPVETDRLAAVGGEMALQPYGGETLTAPVGTGLQTTNLVLTWKTAETTSPEIPWYMTRWTQMALFADTNGNPVANSTAYLYVTIVDGLPPGEHELTLITEGSRRFGIEAIEVHRPPLMTR